MWKCVVDLSIGSNSRNTHSTLRNPSVLRKGKCLFFGKLDRYTHELTMAKFSGGTRGAAVDDVVVAAPIAEALPPPMPSPTGGAALLPSKTGSANDREFAPDMLCTWADGAVEAIPLDSAEDEEESGGRPPSLVVAARVASDDDTGPELLLIHKEEVELFDDRDLRARLDLASFVRCCIGLGGRSGTPALRTCGRFASCENQGASSSSMADEPAGGEPGTPSPLVRRASLPPTAFVLASDEASESEAPFPSTLPCVFALLPPLVSAASPFSTASVRRTLSAMLDGPSSVRLAPAFALALVLASPLGCPRPSRNEELGSLGRCCRCTSCCCCCCCACACAWCKDALASRMRCSQAIRGGSTDRPARCARVPPDLSTFGRRQ